MAVLPKDLKCPYQSNLIVSPLDPLTGLGVLSQNIGATTTFVPEISGNIDIHSINDSGGSPISNVFYVYAPCMRHKCRLWDNKNLTCGANVSKSMENSSGDVPLASKLIGEFMGNEDLDGDGLVYGYDYKICDGTTKPPMLKAVENSPDWVEPSVCKNWADYVSGVSEGGLVQIGDSPVGDIGTYFSEYGGYYVGTISCEGSSYKLYTCPRQIGEFIYPEGYDPLKYCVSITEDFSATSECNGYDNTQNTVLNDEDIDSQTAVGFIKTFNDESALGFNDWYIPSISEMELIIENVIEKNMSGTDWSSNNQTFDYSHWAYWTSTEVNNESVWQIIMDSNPTSDGVYTGLKASAKKFGSLSVRFIRREEVV